MNNIRFATNKKVIAKLAAQYASEKRATLSIEYELNLV
jgi:hypothetical protein